MRLVCVGLILLVAAMMPVEAAPNRSIPSAQDDLDWLNGYLQTHAASRQRVRPSNGPGIAFVDLKQRIGTPLRVTLADGVSRFGVLVEANAKVAKLNVRVGAGDYLFAFEREQVTLIEER